jgi:hypothetical protein
MTVYAVALAFSVYRTVPATTLVEIRVWGVALVVIPCWMGIGVARKVGKDGRGFHRKPAGYTVPSTRHHRVAATAKNGWPALDQCDCTRIATLQPALENPSKSV